MALHYTLKDTHGYLLVTASGSPDSIEEMFRYIDAIFQAIKNRGYPSVLIDESGASLRFDIMNAVFRQKVPSLNFESMQIVHIAIVSAPHSIELYKFFEGVFKDHPFRFMAFDDAACGLQWLKKTGAPIVRDGGYSYTVAEIKGYVRIDLDGKLDEVGDMLVLSGELIREASARNSSCILLDGRNADVDLDVSQAFKIAQTLGDYIPLLGLRIASVPNPKHLEMDRFFETVFQNRSINYRVFESEMESEEWLTTQKGRPVRAS